MGNATVGTAGQVSIYGPNGRDTFTGVNLDTDKPPAGGGDASAHAVSTHHPNSLGVNHE